MAGCRRASSGAQDGRHQHEDEHREEVFDHEPADGDVACRRVELPVVRQHADENDRARHRQRDVEYHSGPELPSCACARRIPRAVATAL
jgi:hypothetical protein